MSDRTCPNCEIPLTERALAGQLVDCCERCGGQYYDAGELEQIVGLARLVAEVELDEPEVDVLGQTRRRRQLPCVGCGETMTAEEVAGTAVDRCPSCGGVWLDDTELAAIRLAEMHVMQNLALYLRLGE